MKALKRILSVTVLVAMLMTTCVFAIPFEASAAYDNFNTYTITEFDTTPPSTSHSGVYVFPNTADTARVINASDYSFNNSKLMIFNGDGYIIECGGNVYPNSTTVTGSPQLTLTVPAGGFLLAFGTGVSGLMTAYDTAMEGAMLYNATMTVNYEIKGSYNTSTNKLTIEYNDPVEPSASAKKFMFVGNSTTYFNGTPIKFKGMAEAAGIEVDVSYCTKGSAYLSYFADETHDAGIMFREKLAEKSYDYIVLQDAGKATYANSKPAMEILMPLIEENGAEAMLYKRYASETNYEDRLAHAEIHNYNYNRLAKEYDIDYCAPVADAFLLCDENYPQINLYADDNAHHSAAGSYLIALVWMITYFGVDIADNPYTANLPEETVAILKECATKACEEGYPFEPYEDDGVYVVDGVAYDDVALNKTYTSNGTSYTSTSNQCTDHNSDGTIIGDLTDGIVAVTGSDAAIGCHKGATVDYTIDLGGYYRLKAFKTDLYGGCWGIPDPNTIDFKISVSIDGVNFTELGTMTKSEETMVGDWQHRDFTFITGKDNLVASYIRFTAVNSAGTVTWIWASELFVYGEAYDNYYMTYIEDDVVYEDVAFGKTYTSNGTEYHDTDNRRTDHNDDGTIIGKLTDGTVATAGSDAAIGCHKGATVDYTIDLGGYYNLKAFKTDLYGGTWGIPDPNTIDFEVSVSTDGANFTELGTMIKSAETTSGDWMHCYFSLATNKDDLSARYVRFTAVNTAETITWIWASELLVFGYNNNLTQGNSYTTTLTPGTNYPDTDNTELTDGIKVSDDDITTPYYKDSRWVGTILNNTIRSFDIVMPLGDGETVYDLHMIELNVGGDGVGGGVTEPDITAYYSLDGESWTEFGGYTRVGSEKLAIDLTIMGASPVRASYIKLNFTLESKNLVWISEIAAFGNVSTYHEHEYAIIDGTIACSVCGELYEESGLYYDEASGAYYCSDAGTLVNGWYEIEGEWYYFGEDYAAVSGDVKVDGVWFSFDETGKTEGAWANTLDGKRYYYGPSYYESGWYEIDGTTYYFDGGYPVEGIHKIEGCWYNFDENGSLVGTLNGVYEIDGTYYYIENGLGAEKYLIEVDGNYYFAQYDGVLVTNTTMYAWISNCDLPTGTYTFGADGKLVGGSAEGEVVCVNGVYYYYENGVGVEKGLVKVGEDYYFSQYGGELIVSQRYYAWMTNCDLSEQHYEFGADGKMLRGIVEKDGKYYYYENGNGKEAGLVCVDGEYYFAGSYDGEVVTNARQYAWLTNCDLPEQHYEFGADGKMLRGIVEKDGKYYYYENGNGKEAGLVCVDGEYYFAGSYDGEVVTNAIQYAWLTNCDLPEGRYEFGADGKMLNGIVEKDGVLYYYENGNGVEAGLVCVDGEYYFAQFGGEVVIGQEFYAWMTNCDLPEGKYEFGADGKMLNGIIEKEDGLYYYENGAGVEKGLFEYEGGYYFSEYAGKLRTNETFYAWVSSCDVPAGTYEFGADGKMLDGIVEKDGKYYYYELGNGVEAGLVYVDGYYYFAQYGGELVVSQDFYVYNANGLLVETTYTFDEYGRIVG